MREIKECVEFHEWLQKQDVEIELNDWMPVVVERNVSKFNTVRFLVLHKDVHPDRMICPYYPSASNSLKAIFALEDKEIILGNAFRWRLPNGSVRWQWDGMPDKKGVVVPATFGAGKTDGEALWALCKKIMEEDNA